ncbi:LysM-like peptidoglycan-binding domain-containing protein [Testudinibacter sp. P27/CKL/0425]
MTSDNSQKTGDAGASSNEQQNQLKFEFSNVEPITPKKPIEEKPSFLDKAKGFFPKRDHKEDSVNPNNPSQPEQPRTEPSIQTDAEAAVAASAPKEAPSEVNDNAREPLSNRLKKPETWGLLNRLPAKHRRLFIALLGLILLLLIFFWLKPSSTTTVDALQAQNANALPIEFQPLNQSEEELTNQTADEGNALLLPNNIATENNAVSLPESANNTAATPNQTAPVQQPQAVVAPPAQTTQAAPASTPRSESIKPQPKAAQTSKPSSTTAPAKAQTQPKAPTATKPAARTNSETTASASSRTLTIPQGVTLMQVFRNNNLNIADVNAMTKANGGEKALSSFKPGDKVTVQLNAQGRVSKLTLQNGSSFNRNSDGSYNYKQ